MMQLGLSTYTYGWNIGLPGHMPPQPMTAPELLAQALAADLPLVQFGDNLPLHLLPPRDLEALHQQARINKITLEIGARGLTPAHLQLYLGLAEKLEARLLRFVIDLPGYEPGVAQVVALIKEHLPLLQEKNITLGLENHDRLLAREFAQIITQVDSDRVGICLDSVNSMGAGEGLDQIVQLLAPYTVNLHVKDFGIRRLPHLMGFQIDGRPAGKGLLHVPWLLEQIRPYGRCQTAVLEQWVVPEPDLQQTIAKERAWAQESLQYLKPFFIS
jgi:3-oxoisoapionate decarboxylase